MGNTCNSCESTSVATAKLIFEDGRLEEFSYPVRVSQILQGNPECFVCKADDMEFDEYVSAIDEDEHLQSGHLYFALPSSWLHSHLSTEQMAALAVKASSALMRMGSGGGCCWCGMKKVDPAIEWSSKSPTDETSPMVATATHSDDGGGFVAERRGRSGGGGGFVAERRGRSGGGGRERTSTARLTPRLSAILEE
ncbi:hypothetical protein OIU84_014805 [Salix udensis]|uniref:Uncharacterized protein n=1 Tax=Salix udensis TaxID=889485 RepID=A0AAD6NRS9_9ROSI|nr:hypothetical protein OIU84_014805 [Salix udensis]